MAKLLVYSVYDSKVKAYTRPVYMRSKGEALRSWQSTVQGSDKEIAQFPEDYSLMELGEWDEETGTFTNHPAPINMGLASQYKKETDLKAV